MKLRSIFSMLFACLALADLAGVARDASAADQPPNIIFILADDMGYGDLGCYGQQNFATPNIDRMAAQGMRFTQHYAGSTVCAPSRACLLGGQHTGHVYQRANGKIEFRPDPQDICIARLLKDAGYQTALIGKSGLSSSTDNGRQPNEKGFDHFFGYVSHSAAHYYYPKGLWRDGEKVRYPGNQGHEGEQYSCDLFREDALAWLEAHREGPFFLHLSLTQPHADLQVPDKWRAPFLGKFEEVPFPGNHYRAEPNPKATFAGMMTHLDHSVGAVLDKLRESGVAENTLVLFSSDNGAMNEGGWDREFFDSSGPLRGGKRDMYEGGVRVPLIAWWPETIRAGAETDHVAAFWDFVPTACELAGVSSPADSDGISYAPTLLARGEQPQHDYLYWEFYEQGGKQAVRQGDWKAVRLDVQTHPDRPLELYDLASDVGEEHDVAAEHPDVVARMRQLMREAHVDNDRFTIAE
jgi:arylsulfatase A-like enzyme